MIEKKVITVKQITIEIYSCSDVLPKIETHENRIFVLIRIDGECSFNEAVYHNDGNFHWGHKECEPEIITDVLEWANTPKYTD